MPKVGNIKNLKGKRAGRPKGSKNKIAASIQCMIEGALADAGGQDYLTKQAEENPAAFLGLVGKLLPKDVNAKIAGEMILKVITGVPDAK